MIGDKSLGRPKRKQSRRILDVTHQKRQRRRRKQWDATQRNHGTISSRSSYWRGVALKTRRMMKRINPCMGEDLASASRYVAFLRGFKNNGHLSHELSTCAEYCEGRENERKEKRRMKGGAVTLAEAVWGDWILEVSISDSRSNDLRAMIDNELVINIFCLVTSVYQRASFFAYSRFV